MASTKPFPWRFITFHGKLTNEWENIEAFTLLATIVTLKSVDVISRIALDQIFYIVFTIIWQIIYVDVVLWMMSYSAVEWKLLFTKTWILKLVFRWSRNIFLNNHVENSPLVSIQINFPMESIIFYLKSVFKIFLRFF